MLLTTSATDRLDQKAVGLGVAEVESGHDGVWNDTDDEHYDDDNQHDGYAPAHCDLPVIDAQARPAAQSHDDGDAGEDKDDDGDDRPEKTLCPVVAHDERVDAPQLGQFHVHVPRPVAVVYANCTVAQRRRHGHQRHHQDHGAGHCAGPCGRGR